MATEVEKQQEIAELYDKITRAWVELFGEHMHDGYYEPGTTATLAAHQDAVIRMIDEALLFAHVSADDPAKKPQNLLDVGCGIGSASLYVARKYDITCTGINISPEQVKIAKARAAAQGLESKVSFDTGDALDMPYKGGTFDMVMSIQCIEHVEDKEKFIQEMIRVAAPGATILMLSYAHRNLSPSEESLKPQEKKVLNKICGTDVMNSFCSLADYVGWLTHLPVEDIKTADWTENITPFYPLFLKEVFTWKGITSFIMKTGWSAIKFVMAVRMMSAATRDGLVKLVAVTCRKAK